MSVQLLPSARHRRHWYENESGLPSERPRSAFSTAPSCADPRTTGGAGFCAAAPPATAPKPTASDTIEPTTDPRLISRRVPGARRDEARPHGIRTKPVPKVHERGDRLDVVPKDVVHPGLLGGWGC